MQVQKTVGEGANLQTVVSPLNNPLWSFIKFATDKIGSVAALLIFSPLFLFLIIVIKKDGGPAFYGHTRVGQNGRPFKCWKFRSMRVDAEQVLAEILEKDSEARAEWERDFKLKNDPRITKIGDFIRKTSLDEFPQFYNVLCGDMSLVGPRPVVEDERKYYGDKFDYYLSVKPGITGLWQVSGRNDTTYDERVSLDAEYVQNWSLWLDIKTILKTFYVVIARKGAY